MSAPISQLRQFVIVLTLSIGFGQGAEAANRLAGQLSAGGSFAVGELGDRADNGLGGRAGLSYGLVDRPRGGIEILAKSHYHHLFSDLPFDGDYSLMGGGIELQMTFEQAGGSVLYLALEGGASHVTRHSFTYEVVALNLEGETRTTREAASIGETNPYVSPAIGARLASDDWYQLFAELRYMEVSGTRLRDYRVFTLSLGLRL